MILSGEAMFPVSSFEYAASHLVNPQQFYNVALSDKPLYGKQCRAEGLAGIGRPQGRSINLLGLMAS